MFTIAFGGENGDLRLRGKSSTGTNSVIKFSFENPNVMVSCVGDIRTLIDWETYTTVSMEGVSFGSLFEECTVLTSAPELPATTLSDYCYYGMFAGCTSLTTVQSVLPATTLAISCYRHMFQGCTSLTTAPELPATTLETDVEREGYCYGGMFMGCTSLTQAPELPATTLATYCYRYT